MIFFLLVLAAWPAAAYRMVQGGAKKTAWCGCEAVETTDQCGRSRSLSLHNDSLLCCAWYPRSGYGRKLPRVGSVPLPELQRFPRSLAKADTDLAAKRIWSGFSPNAFRAWKVPVEVRSTCYQHIRTPKLMLIADQSCGLPDQCKSKCCCSSSSDFSELVKKRHEGSCVSPEQCKADGGQCLEKAVPTIQDLKVLRVSGYKWSRVEDGTRAVSFPWYRSLTGSETGLAADEAGACMIKRKLGLQALGLGGILSFGSAGARLADTMSAFHWDVSYKPSAYRMQSAETLVFAKARRALHHIQWSDECVKGPDLFHDLMQRWGFSNPDKMRLTEKFLGTSSFGRSPHFTYVITANLGGLVEMRFARSQTQSGSSAANFLLDYQAKHALLALGQDFVLYAGEARVQLTPAAVVSCTGKEDMVACLQGKLQDTKNAMIILDNDSGTFKTSAAMPVRRQVRELLKTAFGQVRINVCAIPELADEEVEKRAGGPCQDASEVWATDITGGSDK